MPLPAWLPKLLWSALRVLAVAWVVAVVALWLLGNRLMFMPPRPTYRTLPGLVRIPVGADTIAAVWLPNPAARFTVLYSHGNAEDLGDDLPLLRMLRDRGFAVLVLESTFTSAQSVSAWGRIFPFDWFRTARRLPKVRCPVLVIHGTADEVIPIAVGRRLYRLAPGAKQSLWVDGAGHNDLVDVAGERYWQALQRFAGSLRSP